MSELDTLILERIRDVPDYPKQGVLFKDITPLLADPVAMAAVVDELAGLHQVDKIVGIEARGFILAAPVAYRAGAGFVPVRKKGKLPAETLEESYDLEYGSASIEVHRDALASGERVLIVDDVLATGGTAAAAVELVRRTGAEVAGVAVLMELAFLHGRERLTGVPLHSLVIV
ncbi:adenine phosphoribosyltransferase [Nonomuraea sp. B10E15]|uniref:adenine phosphoribosyltransferase n=1 Tax=unclassified Nonomuraea TaxID=2593643 RepID=UPI00325E2BE0